MRRASPFETTTRANGRARYALAGVRRGGPPPQGDRGPAALAKSAGARGVLDLCAGQFVTPAAGQGDAKPGLWVLTEVVN